MIYRVAMMRRKIKINELLAAMERCQYKIFTGDLNLNLVAIRNSNTRANTFNDVFCVLYQKSGEWQLEQFKCTTDPGTYYRNHPVNIDGTAVVAPGQYRSLWTFGNHQGRYPALVQHKPIRVYRDADKDNELDTDGQVEQTGYFGINCHRANAERESTQVDKWSAGCQVIANPDDFDQLIGLCRLSENMWGNTFTYTLLTQENLTDTGE